MLNRHSSPRDAAEPDRYQIRIKGQLSSQWMHWFDGLTITLEEDGNTLLSGPVVDQSALHGILKKIRDLGMPLISINPAIAEVDQPTSPGDAKLDGDIS